MPSTKTTASSECPPLAGTSSLKKLSLEYYNRAIRSMVKKLEGKDNILVPVMGCVIFVCLEFLRRDMASATKHIDGGIKNDSAMAGKASETREKGPSSNRGGRDSGTNHCSHVWIPQHPDCSIWPPFKQTSIPVTVSQIAQASRQYL